MTTPTKQLSWFDFKNDSGEEVPPLAVIELVGDYEVAGQATSIVKAEKPGAGTAVYAINGSSEVPIDGFGRCTRSDFSYVGYEADEQPAVGVSLGVTEGEWYMKPEVGELLFTVAGLLELGYEVGDGPDQESLKDEDKVSRIVWITGGSYCALGVTPGEIPAADWTQRPPSLGKGDVEIWVVKAPDDPDNPPDPPELEQLLDDEGDPVVEEWYNVVPSPISADRVVVCRLWQGRKIVIVESCVPVSLPPE